MALVVLAYTAGQAIRIDDAERNAAVRRALFVFAAGGDPHRDPELDDPAVLELARDMDSPERRGELVAALHRLDGGAELAKDPERAWQAFACALLAEAIGED